MQANKKGNKRKIWPWVLASVVLVVAAVFFLSPMRNTTTAAFQTYTVSRGDLVSTITGSGTLQAEDVKNIDLPDSIVVSKVLVKAGDVITKGDTLAILDDESLGDRAAYLLDQLATLDNNISNRETSQYIYTPVEGRIKYMPATEGDDVVGTISEHGVLATISTDGLMKIEITTEQELSQDSEITVKWSDTSKTGEVARKTASGYVITLTDQGTPYKETAQVYDEDTLIGEGILEINAPITVQGNSGTIKEVNRNVNSYVYANSILFTLKNAIASTNYRLALAERNETAEQLHAVLMYINNPQIVAPYDGLVSEVVISDNAETGSGNSTSTTGTSAQSATGTSTTTGIGFSTAFVLHTGGAVKMFISVDELDVNSVVLEQEVTIMLDAFEGESYPAKVAHISKLGTETGNITTYPVELSLDYNERFFEGMNGSAVIVVDRVEKVLVIPVAAIFEDSTGIYVTKVNGGTLTRVDITTGVSDGVNAEVTSGLSENDIIQYVDTGSSSTGATVGFGGLGAGSNPLVGGGVNRSPLGGVGQ
ncbi:MAG: hypothetical protein WBI14_05815 [Anaerolineaceae bacterium]